MALEYMVYTKSDGLVGLYHSKNDANKEFTEKSRRGNDIRHPIILSRIVSIWEDEANYSTYGREVIDDLDVENEHLKDEIERLEKQNKNHFELLKKLHDFDGDEKEHSKYVDAELGEFLYGE